MVAGVLVVSFNSIEWIRAGLAGLGGGGVPFNSIEWIPIEVLNKGRVVGRLLSIPLNGFQWSRSPDYHYRMFFQFH